MKAAFWISVVVFSALYHNVWLNFDTIAKLCCPVEEFEQFELDTDVNVVSVVSPDTQQSISVMTRRQKQQRICLQYSV